MWQTASSWPALPPEELHLWRVRLTAEDTAVYQPRLNTPEQARADRFHFPQDRHNFIVARGVLRTILGRYLERPPEAVRFRYGPHGKPALADVPGLQFNLSHAGELAVLAVSWGRAVGVDVEAIRPLPNMDAIARRNFSPTEYAAFAALPPAQQPEAFFNCWTRKEAFIKALGEGLTHPLHRFAVSLVPGAAAELRQVDGSETAAQQWQMHAPDPGPGYKTAVVAAGQDWRLRCFGWGET